MSDIEVKQTEEYGDKVIVRIPYYNSMLTLRQIFKSPLPDSKEISFNITMKDFLKRAIRQDWTKFRRADWDFWMRFLDTLIDVSADYDEIVFVYTEGDDKDA